MSIPLLIVGGTQEERRAEVDLVPNPDLLVIEPDKPALTRRGRSIGIKEIRSLQKFLQRKPYKKDKKTVVVGQAETMTLAAQQAILKTLEEPPANSQIILLCQHEHQLLDTIVSRCRVKKISDPVLNESALKTQEKLYLQLSRAKIPERFTLVAAYSTNNLSAKEFVTQQLYYLHHLLRQKPETVNVKLITALDKARAALKVNVNPKLTLEVLSLAY
jgi:hypothetical protein